MNKDEIFAPRQVAMVDSILDFLTAIFTPPKVLCSCPPDFVVMWQCADGEWLLGTYVDTDERIDASIERGESLGVFMGGIEAQARADADQYLAGPYVGWAVICRHCGRLYDTGDHTTEGLWA